MPPNIKEVARPIQAVSATWRDELRCPLCDSDLRYAYPGTERIVEDLHQVIKLRQHYYLCTNTDCHLHKPFHAPHNIVLPHKKYSRNVYERAIRLYHEVGNNPRQIAATLNIFKAVTPSKQTIARYIEEFQLLQSHSINEKLGERVLENGELIVIVDGQRSKRGLPSLWTFLDLLTGEFIHAEYLKKADTKTLGPIFQKIEAKYQCKIRVVISDHQKSIVNAVKKYISHAKHQFCHFHFLQNLADPLEKMDSHLHSRLESGINKLYINIADTSKKIQMAPGEYREIQNFFKPLVDDLKSQVMHPSRSFDTWGSIDSYEGLKEYNHHIHNELIPIVKSTSRIGIQLQKTYNSIENLLEENKPLYEKLCILLPKFNRVRDLLGLKVLTKNGMRDAVNHWANSLKKYVEKSDEYVDLDAPIILLTYRATVERVFVLWYRLYKSHKSGLFEFLEDMRIPRTNTEIEREYSQELGFWRGLSGRGNVNHYVHVKGDIWLRNHRNYCADEIQTILDTYSLDVIREGLKVLEVRRKEERSGWRRKKDECFGLQKMKERIKEIVKKSRLLSS